MDRWIDNLEKLPGILETQGRTSVAAMVQRQSGSRIPSSLGEKFSLFFIEGLPDEVHSHCGG